MDTEDLLVGNQQGNVFYYVVEWPAAWEVTRDNWPGTMTLVANITVHTAQICGLVWSPNGHHFATGADDNLCCLFETERVLRSKRSHRLPSQIVAPRRRSSRTKTSTTYDALHGPETSEVDADGAVVLPSHTSPTKVRQIDASIADHRWLHGAAVKAMAFCPWQEGLLATGGGSNDKGIHFFHTRTGTPLATIDVAAQVTSLIWSRTRREILATFGYTQPEHPYRIAVFEWPSCEQVGAIRWNGGPRALYAVPYPIKVKEQHARVPTGRKDGSIVVAASDGSIKFHEV